MGDDLLTATKYPLNSDIGNNLSTIVAFHVNLEMTSRVLVLNGRSVYIDGTSDRDAQRLKEAAAFEKQIKCPYMYIRVRHEDTAFTARLPSYLHPLCYLPTWT